MAQLLVGAKWVSGATVGREEHTAKKWTKLLMCLQGKLNILQLLFFFLFSAPLSSSVLPVQARLFGLTLGSGSQMLPWGKQKHLSSAQPWLSLSDKSWGGLCQRCPACHLSPSYTISHTQPLPIHTVHPICTRLPSSWQCDRSRWFTPPLPSGLLCSRPRLAHLCREWEGLSPLANTSGENPVFSKGLEELKSLLQSFPSIRNKKKILQIR